MIEGVAYWQQDLRRTAKKLEQRYRQKRWSTRSSQTFEKEIFLSFFIIRKLIESNKLSTELVGKNIEFMKYPRTDNGDVSTEPKNFIKQYNVVKGENCQLSLEKFSSQFIHSYIFTPFVPFGTHLVGIYFCSDRHKDKYLYYVTFAKIVEIIHGSIPVLH